MSRVITENDHLTDEQIQELAETFVGYFNTEEKEKAWEIGEKLYFHFQPLVKDLLFGKKNKMGVEKGVWTSTLEREGFEDMLSEGKVQFFELLTEYDPSSGVYFAVYTKRKLEYGIFNYLRNGSSFDNAMKAQDSLDELMDHNYFMGGNESQGRVGGSVQFSKYLSENAPRIESELFEEIQTSNKLIALKVAWNSLNDRQKRVLDLVINREYTLREAGAEMGVHFTTIREIRNTALEKMKKIIKKVMK